MTKAMRFNDGKPKISLLLDMPHAIEGVTKALQHGIDKGYPRNNWKNGFEVDELLDSMMRHILAYKKGDKIDSSGINHLYLVASNAMMLAELHGGDNDEQQ